jgi:hypothetical protein
VAVAEIAALHPVRREAGGEHPAPPPRPRPAATPGFEPAGRVLESTYSLYRQRATGPQPIGVAEGFSVRLVPDEPVAVLLQRP